MKRNSIDVAGPISEAKQKRSLIQDEFDGSEIDPFVLQAPTDIWQSQTIYEQVDPSINFTADSQKRRKLTSFERKKKNV